MDLRGWRIWLKPGMRVKRWIALSMVGICMTSLALAMGLAWFYRNYEVPASATRLVRMLTLQFIEHPWREMILFSIGVMLVGYAFWKLSCSVLRPLLAQTTNGHGLTQIVAEHRFGVVRPPLNIVAIGGGTGLSALLRGIKQHDVGITAIVTVADDGGSTGRIRRDFDIPAPGDIRNCIVALADNESMVGQLFQYRFDETSPELAGHSFGNLFITALAQATGSFERAVIESAKVLAVRGRVLPSTLENVTLCGELVDGTYVYGESTISSNKPPIKRIFLQPEGPDGYEPALAAIINADLIVLGPGSLYTSVLPNLLVSGIAQAIRSSRGRVVYACNVATQPGETDNFDAAEHIEAIIDYLGEGVLNYALVNNNRAVVDAITPEIPVTAVTDENLGSVADKVEIVARDVVNDANPLRHDPDKLAAALLDIARNAKTSSITQPTPVDDLMVVGA